MTHRALNFYRKEAGKETSSVTNKSLFSIALSNTAKGDNEK